MLPLLKEGYLSEPIVMFQSTLSLISVFASPAIGKKKRLTHLLAPSENVTKIIDKRINPLAMDNVNSEEPPRTEARTL